MRLSITFYLATTTILLVATVVMVYYNTRFDLLFLTIFIGQVFWILSVIKVLNDNYSTKKTFDDWYEDHPVDKS